MSTYIGLVHVDTLSCEAILRRTSDGRLIIISQIKGIKEPSKENRVYCFTSFDNGRTWDNGYDIMPDEKKAVYATEVSIIDDEITVYVTVHNGNFLDYENMAMKSYDNATTFVRSDCPYPYNDFVFIRGMLRLSESEILLPYQSYKVDKKEEKKLVANNQYIWNGSTKYVENGVLYSDNNGKTFTYNKPVKISLHEESVGKLWQWTEPTLCYNKDGNIIMLLRINKSGFLYKCVSKDKGKSWSTPEKTFIKNSGNKSKLIQNGSDIILLNTPNSGSTYRDRNPLTISVSADGLQSFYYEKILVDYPGYLSYPDGIAEENKVLFAYEFNRHDIYFVEHIIENTAK